VTHVTHSENPTLKRSKRSPVRGIAKASEAERWSQVLLDAAPDAMVVADQDGKIVLVNTQTERQFGYQREEILGRDVEELIPGPLRDHHRLHRKNFFAEPHVRPMGAGLELFGVRKGGGEFPVEVSLSPAQTTAGVLVTSAIRDITERKLAEGNRFKLAAIVESSDDAIISKNLDAVIVSWNAAAEQIFGYTEQEAVGQPITILIPSELREEENQILERLRAGERIDHYETVRVTKAGKRVDVSLSISPVKDSAGRIVGFSKIARDITQRKEMDRALRETNAEIFERSEQLRLAAQGSQMGLWGWNELTKELFCDATTREMCGVPLDGEVTLETFDRVIHPDDLKWVRQRWRDALEHGLPYELEHRCLRPDGTTRWIYARGSGYYDDAAKPIRMIGVVFDITRRKQIEHEHLELSGRLIQAHEHERSRIARELHDDFSQRLALLATKLQMILDVVGNSQPNVSDRVGELMKTVDEFGADVHALSHSLHSSKLEMLGLSTSVRSFCREFSKQHKIEIDFRHEGLPEPIPSESALCLFRLVQEGLQNVRKHSRASRVDVRLAGASTEISLILSDNGVGFDLSQNHASNGIGILSMRERVRMLHGTFEIQSAPMKGTQITVKIPAV
jgi:PAS domain S-box-containing protein